MMGVRASGRRRWSFQARPGPPILLQLMGTSDLTHTSYTGQDRRAVRAATPRHQLDQLALHGFRVLMTCVQWLRVASHHHHVLHACVCLSLMAQ
jgi:hypothetical protein